MGRYVTDVMVKGTWERTLTSPSDITWVRQLLQRAPFKVYRLEGSFKAARPTDGRNRHGTFAIMVHDVPETAVAERRSIDRAAQYIKWFLADKTCRMPKLKVDYNKSVVNRHWENS